MTCVTTHILPSKLVFFMTPGLGVFYMGLARMKNSLSRVSFSHSLMAPALSEKHPCR